jgi:hypothetical protein
VGLPRHKVQVDRLYTNLSLVGRFRRRPGAWADRAIGEEMLQEEVEAPVDLGWGAVATNEGASVLSWVRRSGTSLRRGQLAR